jgi:hypothetical protein
MRMNLGQLDLGFKTEAEKKFLDFHEKNPQVYKVLLMLAREAVRRGRTKIGMKMLYERARWEFFLGTAGDDEYKLNNNYTAFYARLIMRENQDLRDVFETRQQKEKALL